MMYIGICNYTLIGRLENEIKCDLGRNMNKTHTKDSFIGFCVIISICDDLFN